MLKLIEDCENYSRMPSLKGKTIEKIKIDEKDGYVMIYFDDETWVGVTEIDPENAGGIKIGIFHKDDKSFEKYDHFWRTS